MTAVATMNAAPAAPQLEAIEVALHGGTLARLRVAGRSLYRLSRNSEDTTQALLLGIALNSQRFAEVLGRFAIDPVGAELLEARPSIDSHHVDFDALRALPDGTLGREYMRFLEEGELDADFFQAPPGLPPLLAYLAKRIRQSHDLWHVVTGFSSDVPDEIGLQAFTYAQMRVPSAMLLTVFGLLRWGPIRPSTVAKVWRGARLGRDSTYLPTVRWEDHWERPLDELREELGLARAG